MLSLALIGAALFSNAQSVQLVQHSAEGKTRVAMAQPSTFAGVGLPLNLPGILTFSVAPAERQVKIGWEAVKEDVIDRYEVERSTDGYRFKAIAVTSAANQGTYSASDRSPQVGLAYYRVRTIFRNGEEKLTAIREVRMAQTATERTVYPSDNRAGTVFVLLNPDTEDVTLTVLSATGAVVRAPFNRDGRQYTIDLRSLPAGMYYVALDAAGTRSVHRVNYQP